MKKMMTGMIALLFAGSLAWAADAENKEAKEVDSSTNPITGTKTTTTTYEKKMKDEAGREAKVEVEEKKKTKKDGTQKTDVEVDAESVTK